MTYDDIGPEDVMADPEQDAHDDQADRADRGEYDDGTDAWDAIDTLIDMHPTVLAPSRILLRGAMRVGGWAEVQKFANKQAEAALRAVPEYAPAWLAVAVYALEQQHGYLAAAAESGTEPLPSVEEVPGSVGKQEMRWQQVTLLVAYDPRTQDPPADWMWSAGIDPTPIRMIANGPPAASPDDALQNAYRQEAGR